MSAFKLNAVVNDNPINLIVHKNDKQEITKMEINGKRFASKKMGNAYMLHEFKLTQDQINELFAQEGEVIETATPVKAGLKEGEEVTRTKAFRTSTSCLILEITEGLKAGKKTFTSSVSDITKTDEESKTFADKLTLTTYLGTAYGIPKNTVEKMSKADTNLCLTADEYAEIKAKIEAGEALEDVGILKTAGGGSSKTKEAVEPKAPREAKKPLEGYPSWVVRDPQDTIQFGYQIEAKNGGYTPKSNEAYRAENGEVKVGFAEGMWVVVASFSDAFAASDAGVALADRMAKLAEGDPHKNQAERSAEKRCAIFLAKALAGTYKLAFNETADVEKVDPKTLGSKERRSTVYKR